MKCKELEVKKARTQEDIAKYVVEKIYSRIKDLEDELEEAKQKLADTLEKDIEEIKEKDANYWEWDSQ